MDETTNPMQHLIVKCWTDEEFRKRLLADPIPVLKAEGIEVPEGIRINVVMNTPDTQYLIIPEKPAGLTDEEVAAIAGGGAPDAQEANMFVSFANESDVAGGGQCPAKCSCACMCNCFVGHNYSQNSSYGSYHPFTTNANMSVVVSRS